MAKTNKQIESEQVQQQMKINEEAKAAARKQALANGEGACNIAPTPTLTLLQEAHNIIYGDREQTYGDPAKNLNNIAAYWSIHISAGCGEKITLTAQDVCVMMILLKQARLANTPAHKDSLLDTAGYAALADLIR